MYEVANASRWMRANMHSLDAAASPAECDTRLLKGLNMTVDTLAHGCADIIFERFVDYQDHFLRITQRTPADLSTVSGSKSSLKPPND